MVSAPVVAPLESRVRHLIRESGIDPQRHINALDRLIEQALNEHEERSILGEEQALDNKENFRQYMRNSLGGYGALQPLFDDPEVEEIWIDEPSKIFVSRGGNSELTNIIVSEQEVRDSVERMLRASGRRIDLSVPFVDAALASGERLHVVIPDITREHWAVNIRKHIAKAQRLEDLCVGEFLSGQAAQLLDAAVKAGLNILVSGATQAGKTTVLRALLGAVESHERIVSAEEVFELNLQHRDIVAMQTRPASIEGRGEVTLRHLVREAMRMRPERIVIGEVRSAEAFDLLIALNSGIPGACTVHANSAREAIVKLCTLPLLAGENVTSSFVVPTVASSIDIVIHLARPIRGIRYVEEIVGITGRIEGDTVEAVTLFERRGEQLRCVGNQLPRPERFERAGFNAHTLLRSDTWE